jgi:hypothetical protein
VSYKEFNLVSAADNWSLSIDTCIGTAYKKQDIIKKRIKIVKKHPRATPSWILLYAS